MSRTMRSGSAWSVSSGADDCDSERSTKCRVTALANRVASSARSSSVVATKAQMRRILKVRDSAKW